MNKAELYKFTRPEQPLLINLDKPTNSNAEEQPLINLAVPNNNNNTAELLHSVGMSPTRRMRVGAAVRESGSKLNRARHRVMRLRNAIPIGLGSVSGLLLAHHAEELPPIPSGIIGGGLVFALVAVTPYVIDDARGKYDRRHMEVRVKHGSIKKAWKDAQHQFPETLVRVNPQKAAAQEREFKEMTVRTGETTGVILISPKR